MREFYELVGDKEHVLRTTSFIAVVETAKFWLHMSLVQSVEVHRIRDACVGSADGRTKLIAGRVSGGGWSTTTDGAEGKEMARKIQEGQPFGQPGGYPQLIPPLPKSF